jgi:hypothetical protein
VNATPDHADSAAPPANEPADAQAARPATRLRAVAGAALRTWLRYLVPLLLLSMIAMSPVIALALRAPLPVDQDGAKSALALGWELVALAWPCQLVLVGAATAMTRDPPSQLRALSRGLVHLGRALVPCLVATAAILVASLALVVPGVILLALLALTGASPERGLPRPLVDSVAIARKYLPAVVVAVVAMLALDISIGLIAQLRVVTIPIPRQPNPAQLAGLRTFVRAIALSLVLASPLPATLLATIRSRAH